MVAIIHSTPPSGAEKRLSSAQDRAGFKMGFQSGETELAARIAASFRCIEAPSSFKRRHQRAAASPWALCYHSGCRARIKRA